MEWVLDTHPLVFLMYQPRSLSSKARKIIGNNSSIIRIPTMVLLEIKFLIDAGKIEADIRDVVHYIRQNQNFIISGFGEDDLISSFLIHGNRDPFDRIILATAMSRRINILTRDSWMKKTYDKAEW